MQGRYLVVAAALRKGSVHVQANQSAPETTTGRRPRWSSRYRRARVWRERLHPAWDGRKFQNEAGCSWSLNRGQRAGPSLSVGIPPLGFDGGCVVNTRLAPGFCLSRKGRRRGRPCSAERRRRGPSGRQNLAYLDEEEECPRSSSGRSSNNA